MTFNILYIVFNEQNKTLTTNMARTFDLPGNCVCAKIIIT